MTQQGKRRRSRSRHACRIRGRDLRLHRGRLQQATTPGTTRTSDTIGIGLRFETMLPALMRGPLRIRLPRAPQESISLGFENPRGVPIAEPCHWARKVKEIPGVSSSSSRLRGLQVSCGRVLRRSRRGGARLLIRSTPAGADSPAPTGKTHHARTRNPCGDLVCGPVKEQNNVPPTK